MQDSIVGWQEHHEALKGARNTHEVAVLVEKALQFNWGDPEYNEGKARFSCQQVWDEEGNLLENELVVVVLFDEPEDRDFEKFWCDYVWGYFPHDWNPSRTWFVDAPFKDGSHQFPTGTLVTGCTFTKE